MGVRETILNKRIVLSDYLTYCQREEPVVVC